MSVGILLVTHAPLGSAFIQAATHVFRSRPERLEAIDVQADQDRAAVREAMCVALDRLDDGTGVLVMADIMGGTPCNCCADLHSSHSVATVTGISLPMLLRALTYRSEALDVVVERALAGAQHGAARLDAPEPATPG